jgi:anaerobic magnesium-protoporphyrin IX monomethyl ester cyclase
MKMTELIAEKIRIAGTNGKTQVESRPISDEQKKNYPIALISLYNAYNLGIRYIHAMLKAKGYNVHLIFFGRISANDAQIPSEQDYANLLKILKDHDVKFVGLSLSCTTYYEVGTEISKRIRKEMPGIVQLWGGVHTTICPEDCIDYADYICLGEGEYPTLELVESLICGDDPSKILSLGYKNKAGEYIQNPMRAVISDLDALPWPTWDDHQKWTVLNGKMSEEEICMQDNWVFTMTSRGCPFHCTYCVNNCYHRHYREQGMHKMRFRSADNVMAELRDMKEKVPNFPLRHIGFYDDEFSVSEEWIKDFSQKYTAEFDNTFWCYFHPNMIKESMITPLKEMGLTQIDMGVQTGSERVRKEIYQRPETNDKVRDVMKMLQKHKMNVVLDIITDCPYETEQDKRDSLDFFLSLPRPYEMNFYSLIWFPKVELTEWALRDGYITRDDVEDRAKKTMEQFVSTIGWKKRSKEDTFWVMLYFMAARGIYSKGFIKFLSKQNWLINNLWLLRFLFRWMNIVNLIKKFFKALWYVVTGKWSLRRLRTRISNYLVWEKPFDK